VICILIVYASTLLTLKVNSFLGHLLRDDLINPIKISVREYIRPSVCTSAIKHNAATNQIVIFVKVDETFMMI